MGWRTVGEVRGFILVNQRGTRFQVGIAQQLLRGELHMRFIRHVTVEIGQRQFHGFNRQMQRLHGIRMMFFDTALLQNAKGNQRGDPLPVWRQLLH